MRETETYKPITERAQQGVIAGIIGLLLAIIAGLISPFSSPPVAGISGIRSSLESEISTALIENGIHNSKIDIDWKHVEVELVSPLPPGTSIEELESRLNAQVPRANVTIGKN